MDRVVGRNVKSSLVTLRVAALFVDDLRPKTLLQVWRLLSSPGIKHFKISHFSPQSWGQNA